MKQNKGAVVVLLMCVMGSLILITGILLAASISAAGKSYADATLQISGKSILSEFDKKLLLEYGLLCFRGDEKDIKNKLDFYINGTFDSNRSQYLGLLGRKNGVDILKFDLKGIDVSLKGYSMVDADMYEAQIREALKTVFLDTKERIKPNDKKNIVLRNEIVIKNLPSAGYKDSIFPDLTDVANIPDWKEIVHSGTNKFARCEYIMRTFKYANTGGLNKETFFNNEVEYILEGKYEDEGNYRSLRKKLYAMRYALNAVYLLSDGVKMAEITAQASLVGPATPAAEAAIFATWVGAESNNDLKLLENGEKVAIIKSPLNWALNDLVEVVKGIAPTDNAISPNDRSGQSYDDYLRVFLYLADREIMLLRMMDITQINMKGNYYRDFLLKEYFAGFRFGTMIKGDTFNYVHQY